MSNALIVPSTTWHVANHASIYSKKRTTNVLRIKKGGSHVVIFNSQSVSFFASPKGILQDYIIKSKIIYPKEDTRQPYQAQEPHRPYRLES